VNPTTQERLKTLNAAIDGLRTHAWLVEVSLSCQEGDDDLPTPVALRKREWMTGVDAANQDFRFDRYADGHEIPSQETVRNVDECLGYEKLTGCAYVFESGPDNIPLWALLREECSPETCLAALDAVTHKNHGRGKELLTALSKSAPFSEKLEHLWRSLGGTDLRIDFRAYDQGTEPNLICRRLEEERTSLLPDQFAAVLAARHIAESRKEGQAVARYLFDVAVWSASETFGEWNIGSAVRMLLMPRKSYIDPLLTALAETQPAGTPQSSK